jgi:hypothetical protein
MTEDHLMWSIHTDIIPTGRHIFFLPPGEAPKDAPEDVLSLFQVHMRRVERFLYIFGLNNAYLPYLQGFNELAVVLFFVNTAAIHYLNNDPLEAEALTYACFVN